MLCCCLLLRLNVFFRILYNFPRVKVIKHPLKALFLITYLVSLVVRIKHQQVSKARCLINQILFNCTFYDFLLKAIDNSFLSLGEEARKTIYAYLENSMDIKIKEIPFRIMDFQKALENLLGIRTRRIEILVIKNLHDKIKIKYKENMPCYVIPEITFQQYIRYAKMNYENSFSKRSYHTKLKINPLEKKPNKQKTKGEHNF